MKLVFAYLGLLVVTAAIVAALGYRPTRDAWGESGIHSLWAANGICLAGALVAAVPVAWLASRKSPHTPQACLAGTVIRLLVSGGLAMGYQARANVHLRSFLIWLLGAYLALLAVETVFNVIVIRRYWPSPPEGRK